MLDKTTRKRAIVLQMVMLAGFSSLVGRLGYLQLFQGPELVAKAETRWIQKEDIQAIRGTIYDRNGHKLAYTTIAYNISADLKQMKDAYDKQVKEDPSKAADLSKEAIARKLAPLLGMNESTILSRLQSDAWGVDLKQRVDSDVVDKIVALKLPGIFTTRTTARLYPNKTLAAHVLGFVNANGQGGEGIELQYDEYLRGKNGSRVFMKDNSGNPLPYQTDLDRTVPAQNGKDIYLTIDQTIQQYVEDALDKLVKEYKPKHASIIVSDPNTGEILALANRPTYDPNTYNTAPQAVLDGNYAVTATFEPGSTFKIVTVTAALAEKKVNLDDTFDSGAIKIKGYAYPIHDWNYTGWGRITFREGVYRSSNVAMINLANRMGWDTLYSYIYKYGFDQRTGVDLPGEGQSILFTKKQETPLNLATSSFGQGNSVTPMQQVAAVSAVANGGKVMRPHLLKEVRDPKSHSVLMSGKPFVISEVATPEVMKTMRNVMEGVVSHDESKAGYIPGYHIAGKTGTAQIIKPDGGYEKDRYITSFIGFAPADQPKVEVYVTVDSPKTDIAFGNTVATPAAKKVFSNIIPYLNIYPDASGKDASASKGSVSTANNPSYVEVPQLLGMSKNAALTAGQKSSLRVQWVGDGKTVSKQWPAPGQQAMSNTPLLLLGNQVSDSAGLVKIPDLTGLSLRESMEVLTLLGLQLDPVGNGYAFTQKPQAGAAVPSGSSIRIEFKPPY